MLLNYKILFAAFLSMWMLSLPVGMTASAETTATTIGGDFALTDQHGKTVKNTDFRGRVMLVFFGFTHCPDVCPVTLSTLAKTLDALGDKSKHVAAIFITVDPKRDTVPVLKNFLAPFNGKIVGLTGTPESIKKVSDAYKIYFSENEASKKDGSYVVDHSTIVYMMGEDGTYLRHFSYDVGEQDLANAIKEYLKKI